MSSNEERQEQGYFIIESMNAFADHNIHETGRELVELFLENGYGERADIRSTIVDMVANLGHFLIYGDGNFEAAIEKGNAMPDGPVTLSTDTEKQAAIAISALKAFASEEGHSFDDILWIAEDHVRSETSSPAIKS